MHCTALQKISFKSNLIMNIYIYIYIYYICIYYIYIYIIYIYILYIYIYHGVAFKCLLQFFYKDTVQN